MPGTRSHCSTPVVCGGQSSPTSRWRPVSAGRERPSSWMIMQVPRQLLERQETAGQGEGGSSSLPSSRWSQRVVGDPREEVMLEVVLW